MRLNAKQELAAKNKPFKIRISAKLLVDQPAGKLETALGSFEMSFWTAQESRSPMLRSCRALKLPK